MNLGGHIELGHSLMNQSLSASVLVPAKCERRCSCSIHLQYLVQFHRAIQYWVVLGWYNHLYWKSVSATVIKEEQRAQKYATNTKYF